MGNFEVKPTCLQCKFQVSRYLDEQCIYMADSIDLHNTIEISTYRCTYHVKMFMLCGVYVVWSYMLVTARVAQHSKLG